MAIVAAHLVASAIVWRANITLEVCVAPPFVEIRHLYSLLAYRIHCFRECENS